VKKTAVAILPNDAITHCHDTIIHHRAHRHLTFYAEAVDSVLEESDENGDGRISWSEYLSKTRNFDKVQVK